MELKDIIIIILKERLQALFVRLEDNGFKVYIKNDVIHFIDYNVFIFLKIEYQLTSTNNIVEGTKISIRNVYKTKELGYSSITLMYEIKKFINQIK